MRRFFRSFVVFSALVATTTAGVFSSAADFRTAPSYGFEEPGLGYLYGTYQIMPQTVIEDQSLTAQQVSQLPSIQIRIDARGIHFPNNTSMKLVFDPNGQVGHVDAINDQGYVQRGLYTFDGDVLVIHMAYLNEPRPADLNDVPVGVKFSRFYFRRVF